MRRQILSCFALGLWVAVLVSVIGCRLPQVSTRSNVNGNINSRVGGNINSEVKANVHVNPPSPISDAQPLEETTITEGAAGKIALIDVDGLMVNKDLPGLFSNGENPVSVFREKLDLVEKGNFKALVLRINSPGGGATASDIMWRDLKGLQERTEIPVVACLMDTGAGGGYYLAAGADHIVAHPTSVVGGVGVILNLYFLEDLMSQINIVGVPIKAGDNIDLGSPIREMSEDQREILQQIAVEFHGRFKKVVQTGRPEFDPAKNPDVFDGRIYSAKAAKEAGLIDNIGYLDDAITTAKILAECPDASIVMLRRPSDKARTPYAISPNNPGQSGLVPINIPGINRSQMPTFLYLWQPNPTLESIGG